jgi:cell division GTPase FtsZ
MVDYVIGAGQGGCRIAKTFSEEFEVPTCYLNLAKVDFSQLNVPKQASFILDEGGSGRDPVVGEQIAKQYKNEIIEFIDDQFPELMEGDKIFFCVGGGGGSGTGMLFLIANYLIKRKADVLLIYTLPEVSEGLPAKPNALNTLNRIIESYLETNRLTVMVVDNSFCLERFGQAESSEDAGDYWYHVNQGIVRSLVRFWYLTNLEEFSNFIDVTAGYGALDDRELIRILYAKGGFIDLRDYLSEDLDLEAAKSAQFRSLVFGNLDIGTTKAYIAVIGFPNSMRNDPKVSEYINIIFKRLEKVTKTPFVLRSTHFNKKLETIRVNVLLSGLVKSHGMKKIIGQTKKDVDKYKAKGGIERLDLDGLKF